MTVNVTHVNHAPISSGGLAVLASGSVKTFAAGDFQFSDVDAGDTLSAIKIISLPAHGTLNLGGTPIASVPSAAIPLTSIPTLTYTPAANYSGADAFNFQVSDGIVFSADATMAVTLNYAKYITVQNGSFEITNPGDNTWSDGNWMYIPSPWTANMGGYGRIRYSSAGGVPVLTGGGTWIANMTDAGYDVLTQNLGSQTFSAGDTISVTFYVCRDSLGSGVLQASFLVGATTYSQTFDTSTQAVNTWQSYTLTATIPTAVTANLSLKFSNVSGRAGWLDNVGNVGVMAASSSTPVITLADTLGAVNTTYGTASATPTSFHVAGSALSGNLTVTPPAGYEVSLSSGTGYTTSLTITASGTLASTQVYARLAATAGVASSPYAGNISVSGGGASSKTIAAASSTVAKATPVVVVTPYTVTYDGYPHTATVTSITGVNGQTGAAVGSVTLTTTHTTAGTYATDSWSFTGTANYNNIGSTTLTDTINKATPTATLAVSNSPVTYDRTAKMATVSITTSSGPGAVQNVLTGGAATQTAAGTYAVTANFVPTDTTNYNALTGLSAGNFVITAATYASWATTNGVTGGVTGDPNHDGVQNGVAYFMGVTGPAANPAPDAGRKVTWTNGGNIPSTAYGTQFVVQTSPDLVTWTPVAGTDPKLSNTAGSVSYTLPPGAGKTFVRLVVTPN